MKRIWVVVVGWGLIVGGASSARADFVYLALGDSSAFGETDRTRNPSNGDRGYVAPFADSLAARNGGVRPTVLNLALDGETTVSFRTGLVADRASPDGIFHNTNYATFAPDYPSQFALLQTQLSTIAAAGDSVGVVTVQLGANDLSNAAEAPGFLDLTPAQQQAQIAATIGAIGANLAGILADLQASLSNAEFYVIGYHNPYGGAPDHPFYDIAAPAVQGLNATIAAIGQSYGAQYVDFYNPILGRERELTLIDLFPQDLVNYVHLNDEGYRVVADELIRTSQAPVVPVPPGVVLFGVGALVLRLTRSRQISAVVAGARTAC